MTIRPGGRCAVLAGKIEHQAGVERKHNVASTVGASLLFRMDRTRQKTQHQLNG